MLKKISVESKFSLTATLGIVALLIAGFCVMLSFVFVQKEWSKYSDGFQAKKNGLIDIRTQIGYGGPIQNNFNSYLVSGNVNDLERFSGGIDEMVLGMGSYRAIDSLTQVEEFSLKGLMALLGKYRGEAYRAQQLLDTRGMTREARELFVTRNNTRLADISALLSELERVVFTPPAHFTQRINQLMTFIGGVFIALVLLVAVFGFRIMHSIVKPLGNSVQELNKVAAGNLIERVEASSRNEISRMAESVNQAVNRMCSIMSPIDYNSGVPSNIPETMDWISHRVNGSPAETSAHYSQSQMVMVTEEAEEGSEGNSKWKKAKEKAEGIEVPQYESTAFSKTSNGSHFQEVANEVKRLASDTIQATEDIAKEIEAFQKSTRGAIQSVTQITSVMGKVNQKYVQARQNGR